MYYHQAAETVRNRGRGNDTELVHMTPREVAGIASLAPDKVTVNPDTGLPEFGFFENILPAVVGVGANLLFPGIGALGTAGLVGGTSALTSGSLEKGLLSGLLSYGVGSLLSPGSEAVAEGAAEALKAPTAEALKSSVGEIPASAGLGGDIVSGFAGTGEVVTPYAGRGIAGGVEALADPVTRSSALDLMWNSPTFNRDAMLAGVGGLGLMNYQEPFVPPVKPLPDIPESVPNSRDIVPHPNETKAGLLPEHEFFNPMPMRGFAEGGTVKAEAPNRDAVVQEAILALVGKHPEPDMAIKRFVDLYGPEALAILQQKIKGRGGLVQGPGGPQDDAVPAKIQETGEPVALSNGEYVVPADAVSGLGNGSTEQGANKLQAVVDAVRRKRAAA